MNSDLIKFIEFCLSDGVISDKEREVIFRKAKEYGVPEDECEIIIEGMIVKNQKSFQKVTDSKTKISTEDNYIDDSLHKEWFLNWFKVEKELNVIKNKTSEIFKNFILNEIDGSIGKGSINGDPIKKDTLLKMCELENIPEIPDSFWKKGTKGKKVA